ncbi:MAG: nitroreductase [Bryobacteraceae bacterium]
MELIDALYERSAVREFTSAPIDRPTIASLFEAAILAPSAMNLQPWAFAVITDPEWIENCSSRAKAWLLDNGPQIGLSSPARDMLEAADYSIFYHAPVLVMVLARSASAQASEDCCLAAQNLMLAGYDKGIGSCWIGFSRPWLNLPAIKRELGIPDQYQVVAPIVLGIPKQWPKPHGRRPAEVHWLEKSQSNPPAASQTLANAEVILRDFDGSRTIYSAALPLPGFVHTTEVQDLGALVGKTYVKTADTDDHARVVYAERR